MLAASVAAVPCSTSYLSWMADSFIRRGVPKTFHYTEAVLYEGMEAAYALHSNETIANWYRSQIDALVLENGTIEGWEYEYYSLDEYRAGNNYLWWWEKTGEDKYKRAADIIRNQLNQHPRTASGGFWHRDPNYPNQMWLDGIFMADSFYAKWTSLFDQDNTTAWDDILLQYDLIEKHTRNKSTGLMVHGYDESKVAVWADPITGAAPLAWDRAVGWYLMSLLEVIPLFPPSHPGHQRLVEYYTTLAAAVKDAQDSSGGWWLIMNEPYPGMDGNYIESSASAMFTFGLFKGIQMGLLTDPGFLETARTGYKLLIDRFVLVNSDGTLSWEGTVKVGSLGSNGTFEASVHLVKLL